MMNVCELLANLIQIFLWTWFVTEYFEFKKQNVIYRLGFLIVWILCFVEISFINQIIVYDGILSGIIVVSLIVYAQLCLKGNLYFHIYVTLYSTAILFSISSIALFITAYVTGMDITSVISDTSSTRLVLLLVCRISEFSVFKIVTKIKKNHNLPKRDMQFFIFIALFTWLAATLMMRATIKSTEIFSYMFALSLILIGMNVVIYYFFVKINSDYEVKLKTQAEKKQYEQQIISQTKHLDEILVMQKKLRAFRHDIQNHFIAISGYFASAEYQAGIDYINGIKDFISDEPESVDTGNVAFDAIISTKRTVAESKGIEFVTNIQIPEKLNIEAIDLCVIFGNALDNAIEACEKFTDVRRYISLSAVYDEQQLICKIVNSAIKPNDTLNTTKPDKNNHGFGIENIKQALSKYNHVMKIDQSNGEFVLSFVIFNC